MSSRRKLSSALIVLLAAALPLTACSSSSEEQTSTSSATREFTDVHGTTEVPENPQRVVVLEPLELDTAIALGITPVGAAVANNVTGIPAYLGVDGIEPVGIVSEPNIEAIAALEPDLILGTDSRHAEIYDRLESIAPTVFMTTHVDPWKDNVVFIGDALGKKQESEDLIQGFNDKCEEIKSEHDVEGKTVNMIRPRDEQTMSLYGPTSFAGSSLECAGLTIPDQEWKDGLQADIAPENFMLATADYVFVTATDVTDENELPEVIRENREQFPSLTLVDTSYWVSGVGPLGGSKVLEDIDAFLDAQQ
ncbi:hypothetical protein J433_00695 [Corynebacterium glutamicum MT]|uniref:iron-siderophore ABC transporter substrate-binding protein n=2 Tax=Corynebacterium glutamicum TaxID=1718 RepID=UPI0003270C22|nr:iron-siderophore ABC transporter substrate-binding protein [Corynebacterium glutamicum]EOA66215.1 hypothetical protein J433_00695 [Corynebacterium glutamicum MT]